MKHNVLLVLALALGVSACGGGSGSPTSPSSPAPPPPPGGVTYVVQDISSGAPEPVAGAVVTVGAVTVTTKEDGIAAFPEAKLGERVDIAAPRAVTHRSVIKTLGRVTHAILPDTLQFPAAFSFEMLYSKDLSGHVFHAMNRTVCFRLSTGLDDSTTIAAWQEAAQTLTADGRGLISFTAGSSTMSCPGANFLIQLDPSVGDIVQAGLKRVTSNACIIEWGSWRFGSVERARHLPDILHFMMRSISFQPTVSFSGGIMSWANREVLDEREKFVLAFAYSRKDCTQYPDVTP